MSYNGGVKRLRLVKCTDEDLKLKEYFGAASSDDWGEFLSQTVIKQSDQSVTRNNLTHRLCGQELKLALLTADAEARNNGGQLLRPAHAHSLMHDFFFNTYSIFEGVFTVIAQTKCKKERHAWKELASKDIYGENWEDKGRGWGDGSKLQEDVISLRDRVHQDKSDTKELEFSDSTYNNQFRQNFAALGKLLKHLQTKGAQIPEQTNLCDKFIGDRFF